MSISQPSLGRERVRFFGKSAEPVVSADLLSQAIEPHEVETFRPLLPVGYEAGVAAYQRAVESLDSQQLTSHYTTGVEFFHEEFVPYLKRRLSELSGGVWSFDEHIAFAAGSDVDFMTHLVEAVAATEHVALFPGDWYGFRVGCTQTEKIHWNAIGNAGLACLCVPSVRNGHVTEEMIREEMRLNHVRHDALALLEHTQPLAPPPQPPLELPAA